MTKLLVSVRNLSEARAAVGGGADILDVKEPERGSLGAGARRDIQLIAQEFGDRVPVSVACGELLELNPLFLQQLPPGLSFAKMGLSGCDKLSDWHYNWGQAYQHLPAAVDRVAVGYADWRVSDSPPPEDVILRGTSLGCRFFLVDTFFKDRRLLDIVDWKSLRRWSRLARENKMQLVLAGSLSADDIPTVAGGLQPFAIAVRGAACDGKRTDAICEKRVKGLKQLLSHLGKNQSCDNLS